MFGWLGELLHRHRWQASLLSTDKTYVVEERCRCTAARHSRRASRDGFAGWTPGEHPVRAEWRAAESAARTARHPAVVP